MSINQIVKIINKYNSFLITSHINPDGDAIGSQFALRSLLKQLGKKAIIINDKSLPSTYSFLGKWVSVDELAQRLDFEVGIVLDSSNLSRLGRVSSLLSPGKRVIIINIDHHISNERFADLNWIDIKACAVGEMIYRLYNKMNCQIRAKDALSIYVAILTDTGSFRYANTNGNTHRVISELIEYGVKPEFVAEKLYESASLASMKLLGLALLTIKIINKGRIGWLYVTNDMLKKVNAKLQDTEDLVNYVRSLKKIEIAIFFSETEVKDEIRVSLRSKGAVDVNLLAKEFGGGGHCRASGCRVKGRLNEVIKKVTAKARRSLTDGRRINR
jgi:phosphoesterase RecJ-like protein